MGNISKYLFIVGIFLLILSGISIISNHLGFAQKIFTSAFWILLAGLVFYLRETKHEA